MMAWVENILRAAKAGGCVPSIGDKTIMLNSLQVRHASRNLMFQSGDFALAERMFADNARFRSREGNGLRFN